MTKLVDVQVAAGMLKVSERTIYRMLTDPMCPLKGVKVYKGSIRVIYDSVQKCLSPIEKNACQSMTVNDNSDMRATPY